MKTRILIVDDEETIRKLLKGRLEREGYDVSVASNADEAQSTIERGGEVSVMITDLKMPGRDGFQLTGWLHDKYPHSKVIVITGHGEKEAAVKSLRLGASDYLEKPFDMDELVHSVKRGAREYQLECENGDFVSRLEARVERVEGKTEDTFWFVSKSPAMNKVNEWMQILRREAMRDAEEPSVLILGESGTGKEGIARMVHSGSRRARGPWVAVNCANFNEQLLDSELFGHERGAFTGANGLKRGLFEIAKGGTLFLDEIGEMDVKLQAKLLRVLQEKVFRRVGGIQDIETDVRVIAATNRNLRQKAQDGTFREDLYHRLSRVVVDIPTLHERREDIVPMALQFADRSFRSRGKHFPGFTPEAEDGLRGYSWPGNVRELLNVVERAALIWDGHGPIPMSTLAVPVDPQGGGLRPKLAGVGASAGTPSAEESYTELKRRWCDSFENEYLVTTLNKNGGNVSAAAREAKLDRSNFLRLLRKHGLKAQDYRKAGVEQDDHGTDHMDQGENQAA